MLPSSTWLVQDTQNNTAPQFRGYKKSCKATLGPWLTMAPSLIRCIWHAERSSKHCFTLLDPIHKSLKAVSRKATASAHEEVQKIIW